MRKFSKKYWNVGLLELAKVFSGKIPGSSKKELCLNFCMGVCFTQLVLSNYIKISPYENNFILTTQATLSITSTVLKSKAARLKKKKNWNQFNFYFSSMWFTIVIIMKETISIYILKLEYIRFSIKVASSWKLETRFIPTTMSRSRKIQYPNADSA